MSHLSGTQDLRKSEFLSWIEGTRYEIWDTKDILVKEATRLCDHPALIIARSKVLFDEVDVSDNIILIDLFGIFMIVISKYETYFAAVVADGAFRVVFGIEVI